MFVFIELYDFFFNMDYYVFGFCRVIFVERNDVLELVVFVFENDFFFVEIIILVSGNVIKVVGFGIMVGFFIVVGLVFNFGVDII